MNFEYLKAFPDFNKLYGYCALAEEFVLRLPNQSATEARKANEFIVKFLYHSVIGPEYGMTVFDMLDDMRFQDYLNDQTLLSTMHYIRKMGNVATHEDDLSQKEAMNVLEELHFLVGEFCINLGLIDDYPEYVKPTQRQSAGQPSTAPTPKPASAPIPVVTPTPKVAEQPAGIAQIAKIEPEKADKVDVSPELVAKYAQRMRQVKFDVRKQRDEDANKKLYLSACLREANWPIVSLPNQAMPCCAGINILLDDNDSVDYVLYGRDNRPLAVIEYTATNRSIVEGRTKGIEKANKLAVKYGYKPVVYYTNGYHIYVIDQLGYKPRRVFQYHTIEELELLKMRASMRQDISNPVIDDSITNRDYQKEAIRAACKAFMEHRRHALLVMATGTGKTRVSISLVDILMKANWVKNVLFLADRTSLVRQAHKNFNKLLPSVTTSVYAGGAMQKDPNARIIFSTYQTMIKLINDDTREFGIGRFDLIIIDEAHRSIFKKYSALFHYYDSLMIGLTATPRAEDNKNTYQMFELPNGKPDYAYELEEAIKEGYLVGFNVMDRTTDALRRGVHYDELTDEEKEQFEDTFASGDDPDIPTNLTGAVIEPKKMQGAKYINLGTIDAMLNDLMKNGLTINGGDKIGKTVIFAPSHYEAQLIVERFQNIYSYLGLDFCKLIDSQVDNNLGLIDAFGDRDQLPQIAVSVDMMDTGIDVPDILNLVFFKQVHSKIKFLQMIGRGTRLSPDVFGPGLDKKGFLVFDYYDNFNYFRTHNSWSGVSGNNGGGFNVTPQSILISQRKLGILRTLTDYGCNSKFDVEYRDELRKEFIDKTNGLCNDDIGVQYDMAYVNKYRVAEEWEAFTDSKVEEIQKHILPLFPPPSDPVKVKNFDLMVYVIEDEVPKRMEADKDIRKIRHGFGNVGKKIDSMLSELVKLKTIPAVVQKEQLIDQMRNADLLFEDFSLEKCERVRKELRDLMAYIPDDVRYYVIDVKDFVIDTSAGSGVQKEKTYVEKAQEFIQKGSPALAKLRNLDELTQEEKDDLETTFTTTLGSAADYAAWSGNKPLLPFLRMQVGISDGAISTKFSSFLNENTLDERQMTYMNQIISYARENGDITFMDLQKVSPFCDVDVMALFGQKVGYVKTLIQGLHKPVM